MSGRQDNPAAEAEAGGGESNETVHARTVVDWVGDCYSNNLHLDTVLRPGQGEEVRCHRLVLGGVSRLLASILPDTEEEVTLILPGLDQADLQTFLRFVYTGAACVKSNSVVQLLHALRVPVPQVPPAACLQHEGEGEAKLQLDSSRLEPQIFAVEQESEEADTRSEPGVLVNKELELFSCPVCSLHFESKSELSEHVASHLGDHSDKKEFGGLIKEQISSVLENDSSDEPLLHSMTDEDAMLLNKSKRIKCTKCDEIFRWKAEYRRHSEIVHGLKVLDLVPCPICKKMIVSKRLNEHTKTVHGNEKNLCCQQCDKKFAKPSELRNHVRTHTGERPFTCNICNASFAYSHILTRHKKYHEGTKRFTCKVCNKSFLQNNDLLKHSRIHTGEKPYSCRTCGKDFARMDYLKKHQMLHSSDPLGGKYCCNECGEMFGSVDGLKKHKAHSHSQHRPNIELNSFDDLAALQLPGSVPVQGLEMETMQAVTLVGDTGGKTIMILNEVADMDSLDPDPGPGLEIGDPDTPVLYAVQY